MKVHRIYLLPLLILSLLLSCTPFFKSTQMDAFKQDPPIAQKPATINPSVVPDPVFGTGIYYALPTGKIRLTVAVEKEEKAGSSKTSSTTSKEGNTTNITTTITSSNENTAIANGKKPEEEEKKKSADTSIYILNDRNITKMEKAGIPQDFITKRLAATGIHGKRETLKLEFIGGKNFKAFLDQLFAVDNSKDKTSLENELRKNYVQLALKYAKTPDTVKFNFKFETLFEPDPNYMYLLEYNGSAFSSDIFEVSVDEKGFLQKVDTSAEDKSDEIIVTLGQLAGKIITFAATGVPSFKAPVAPGEEDLSEDIKKEMIENIALRDKFTAQKLEKDQSLVVKSNKLTEMGFVGDQDEEKIADLEEEIAKLKADISELESKITQLNIKIKSEQNRLRALRQKRLTNIEFPEVFEVVFDPTDGVELANVNNYLYRYGLVVDIYIGEYRPILNDKYATQLVHTESKPLKRLCPASERSICYKKLIPYTLQITNMGNSVYISSSDGYIFDNVAPGNKEENLDTQEPYSQLGQVLKRETIYLPNDSPVYSIDMTRAAFVKKVKNMEFKDGFLTKVHLEKPSEALDLVKIPLDIATALIAVPGEIFKLKIDYSSNQKQLLEAERERLKIQKEVEEARKELDDFIEFGGNSPPTEAPTSP